MIAVHVSHEAIRKIGGIGTVLHGLITAKSYQKKFPSTLLYTPLFHKEGRPQNRLGEDSEVLYSGLDVFDQDHFSKIFKPIEDKYNIKIAYGKKRFKNDDIGDGYSVVDIVAVDIWNMNTNEVDTFKYKLWNYFGIQSEQFSHDRDYEQYLRIAIPLKDIFEALYGVMDKAVVFSHEYMGMASALAIEIEQLEGRRKNDKTIFYAHEVSTARVVVEGLPGQDLAFYNIMSQDRDAGISLEDEFGSYSNYSRNELIKRAGHLDYIFAVSDITKEEYMYLCPQTNSDKIKVVYNGLNVEKFDYSQKEKSLGRIRDYCETLLNFRPDYIFTHVTRFVVSKAIWRDIALLSEIDEHLVKNKKKGVYILLSTLLGEGRSPENIIRMEKEYGWPVLHKEGLPDLVGYETNIYKRMEIFNAKSSSIKCIFVNQFGFDKERCGKRFPEDAGLFDLRLASDVEFGLSIYEPFGIAQLETIPYGGMPVVTNVCGCSFLLKNAMGPEDYISVDVMDVPQSLTDHLKSKKDFKDMTKELRNLIEREICKKNAPYIAELLPRDEKERKARFTKLQKKSQLLDWEHVAERINGYVG